MGKSKYISHASYLTCGDMKCGLCKRKIGRGKYLVVDHFDITQRGNESDWTEVRCKKCSAGDNAWKEHKEEKQKQRAEEKKELNKSRVRAIEIIKSASVIEIEEGSEWSEINCCS